MLSLYIISFFFLGIGIAAVDKYKWSKSRAIGVVIQFLIVIAFTAWASYLWARVEHFGSQPYLNYEVIYVLMFANVKATASWLRGIWITAQVVSALGLSIAFGINALHLFSMREEEERTEEERIEDWDRRGWHFYISTSGYIIAIYFTVMLEISVRRNSTQHGGHVQVDNTWVFGQTLSVVMIFSNLYEVIHFLIGYFRRRERSLELQPKAEPASSHTDVPLESVSYRPRGLPAAHLSALDSTHVKLSSELELSNLNKENSHVQVSELTGGENH